MRLLIQRPVYPNDVKLGHLPAKYEYRVEWLEAGEGVLLLNPDERVIQVLP
jgi:hypothetical protein